MASTREGRWNGLEGGTETLRKVFEHNNDAILIVDPAEDRIVSCNRRACELLGYSRSELVSLTPEELHPGEIDRFRSFVEEVFADGGGRIELSYHTAEDGTFPAEVSASRVEFDGRPHLLASLRAVPDSAEDEGTPGESERIVGRQRDQLNTLNSVNSLVQELIGELVDAGDRGDIQERVCRQLAESSLYRNAWIARLDASSNEIVTEVGAGIEDGYLEAIDAMPLPRIANGTVERAIERGEVAVSRQYRIDGDDHSSGGDIESTAAIPLAYADRVHGVLVINAGRVEAFGEMVQPGLDVLGKAIGFAISAAQSRELLLSDEIVELEFEVADCSCLAVGISSELDCYCQIDRTVPTNDGNYLSYIRVEDAGTESAVRAARGMDSVVDVRIVSEDETGCRLEVTRTECGSEAMIEYGATMRTAEAKGDTGTLVVEAPKTADVRRIVEAYRVWNPESELVAKREVEHSVKTASEFREAIGGRLTEKQKRAIKAAYSAGYYDWPRESNAEELADSLGIASATFHQHLRKAEGELLAAVLENDLSQERGA